MKTYIFKTTTTMKEYNNKKWWIDSNIIPEIKIEANTLKEALSEYQKRVYKISCIEISKNALITKRDMFVDSSEGIKQLGYVITGKSDFQDDNNYRWSTQYIDLWVTILTIIDTDF